VDGDGLLTRIETKKRMWVMKEKRNFGKWGSISGWEVSIQWTILAARKRKDVERRMGKKFTFWMREGKVSLCKTEK